MTSPDKNHIRLYEQWAQWAFITFAFRYPDVRSDLYKLEYSFFILVEVNSDRLQILAETFDNEIRPITADIRVVQHVPDMAVKVESEITLEDEYWSAGAPLSMYQLQRFIGLAAPDIPPGVVDFNMSKDQWEFISADELTADQKNHVLASANKLKLQGRIEFLKPSVPAKARSTKEEKKIFKGHALEIISAREMSQFPSSIRRLVEKDEDEWRLQIDSWCTDHAAGESENISDAASCLFFPDSGAELKLSELLTIYDEIKLVPPQNDLDWLKHNQLSKDELKELIKLGRVQLIFPASIEKFSTLFDVIEAYPDAVVLSRALAGKVVTSGQKKDPLLYGPFTNFQRAELLSALSASSDQFSQALVATYGRHFEGQKPALLSWGAMAYLGYGFGAHLGELLYTLSGRDSRIELSAAGAGVEWALGLNSAFIPRSYTGGYDETHNSLLVASYLSKTTVLPADPVSNRLHTIADGLLSLAGVPPIELAKNFDGRSARQFRRLARQLMIGTADVAYLKEVIAVLNEDLLKFENRTSFLSKLKIDTVAASILAKPLNDAMDSVVPFGSIATAWLYEQLKMRLPHSEILDELKQTIVGMVTASSHDVVILSRAQSDLSKVVARQKQ
jgi:hypothetical protein